MFEAVELGLIDLKNYVLGQ